MSLLMAGAQIQGPHIDWAAFSPLVNDSSVQM